MGSSFPKSGSVGKPRILSPQYGQLVNQQHRPSVWSIPGTTTLGRKHRGCDWPPGNVPVPGPPLPGGCGQDAERAESKASANDTRVHGENSVSNPRQKDRLTRWRKDPSQFLRKRKIRRLHRATSSQGKVGKDPGIIPLKVYLFHIKRKTT